MSNLKLGFYGMAVTKKFRYLWNVFVQVIDLKWLDLITDPALPARAKPEALTKGSRLNTQRSAQAAAI